jgi:hypothetical protein
MLVYVKCHLRELPDCDCAPRTVNDDHLPDCPYGQALRQLLGNDEIVNLGPGLGHGRKAREEAA